MSGSLGVALASTGTLASLKVMLALAGAGLLGWDFGLRRAGRPEHRRPLRDALLAGVALLSALAWFDFAPLRALRTLHDWELYHHFIGGKYLRELGYTRLYDCTLIADDESGFEIPAAQRPIRRLATNRVEMGAGVVADPDACKRHFTPERWDAFREDVRWFRERATPRRWAAALNDHGFNATPAWAIAGTTLANLGPASDARMHALASIDPLLLAAMWAAACWGFGWRTAAVALIFWGTNELGRAAWIGGAFLREDWLAATVVGLALLRRGRAAAAGAALTVATLLRVFPGFLVAAFALRAAIGCWRRRSVRLPPSELRFALGCAAALALVVPLSAAATGSFDIWREFADNSRKHLATPLTNFMGLKTVAAFSPAATVLRVRDFSLPDPYTPWHEAQRASFERRAGWFWAAVVAFGALLAVAVVREEEWAAPILGTGLVVIAAQIGSYYYALLSVYGLLGARREPAPIGLLLLSACTWAIASSARAYDETSMWQSLACVVYAVAVTALAARRGGAAAHSA